MKDQTYKVGENIEKYCADCDKLAGHTVKTVTKTGRVSKVICDGCGLLGTFKPNSNLSKIQNLATKTGEPYDMTKTYRTGQIMSHSTFGTGEVLTVVDSKKIEVLFIDQVRRLVHSRI